MRSGRVVLLALLVLLAGCGSSAPETEELAADAVTVTEALARNDWSVVRADFDPTMAEQLSEQRLTQTWAALVAQLGPYVAHGAPRPLQKPGSFAVVDTPMTFERGRMKSRVSYDGQGRINGLFVLLPEVP